MAVTTADLTGNGKPDIITADYNTNSISVLINETIFPHLTPHHADPHRESKSGAGRQPSGAHRAGDPQRPCRAKARRGSCSFFDGDAVLGVAAISASGIATIDPTKLTLGTHTITAHYGGDGVYTQAFSSAITQQVVLAAETIPLVQATAVTVHLAAKYVPGDRGVADVAVTDIGDGRAIGTVGLQLFASHQQHV